MELDITPDWMRDPDTAYAVKGEEYAGLTQVRTMDLKSIGLLKEILVELRRMNVQLSLLTNQEVSDHDIERVE